MDGGDGPAATIYPTAILINSSPVTWALTGMNKLTWWRWRRWWQAASAYVWASNKEMLLCEVCVYVCVCVERDAKEDLASDLITHFLEEETEPAVVPAFK